MISVCIPTYNGEKYIKAQLDSILTQLEETDEVIVSDDSSTDRTVEIIKSLKDPRIKVLENNHFKSPIFNLENALKNAKGNTVFLADQDDVWCENKVHLVTEALKHADCVLHNAMVVNENLEDSGKTLFELNKSKKGIVHNLIKNSYTGCCMAFNRKLLEKALPFPKDIPMHDSWLGLIAEKHYSVIFLEDRLIKYRRHGNNASATGEKSGNSLKKKIAMRRNLLRNLMSR